MEPYNRQTACSFVGRAPFSETTTSGLMYTLVLEEARMANMPATTGILPITIRAGNPQSTYRLNKIETPRPNTEYVYFHLEKYCTLDASWYPQWLKLSIYCAITREILMSVNNSAIERPERTHFLLTHFIQRAMFPNKIQSTSGTPAVTTAAPTTSTATSAETATKRVGMDVAVESDIDSVDTTAAVIFTPPGVVKKDNRRPVPLSPPGVKKNRPILQHCKESEKWRYAIMWEILVGYAKLATFWCSCTQALCFAFYYPLSSVQHYFSVYHISFICEKNYIKVSLDKVSSTVQKALNQTGRKINLLNQILRRVVVQVGGGNVRFVPAFLLRLMFTKNHL